MTFSLAYPWNWGNLCRHMRLAALCVPCCDEFFIALLKSGTSAIRHDPVDAVGAAPIFAVQGLLLCYHVPRGQAINERE